LTGPTPLPILGNIHQLAIGGDPLKTFSKWAEKYGPIYSIKVESDEYV